MRTNRIFFLALSGIFLLIFIAGCASIHQGNRGAMFKPEDLENNAKKLYQKKAAMDGVLGQAKDQLKLGKLTKQDVMNLGLNPDAKDKETKLPIGQKIQGREAFRRFYPNLTFNIDVGNPNLLAQFAKLEELYSRFEVWIFYNNPYESRQTNYFIFKGKKTRSDFIYNIEILFLDDKGFGLSIDSGAGPNSGTSYTTPSTKVQELFETAIKQAPRKF